MDVNVSRVGKVFTEYAPKRGVVSKSDKTHGASGDSVSVSSAAADYQFARRALEAVSDVREDKVNAAMQMYSANAVVNANAIADKLFSILG